MVFVQRKIRQALGTVKDQTRIGLAKVTGNRLRDLEVAVVKATSHDADAWPLDDKYVKEILMLVSNAPDSMRTFAIALNRRLGKTHNWVVALKGLMLVHRLLRLGDRNFEQNLRLVRASGLLTLNLSAFKDDSSCRSQDFTAFVTAYSRFLDEGLNCTMTPAGTIDNAAFEGDSQGEMGNTTEKMLVNLFDKTPKSQILLDYAIACVPIGVAKRNRLVQTALKFIVRESFQLYADICDSITVMLDNFFEMQYWLCVLSFDIYKKAASQNEQLSEYFDNCKSLGVCGSYEYPTVEKISHLQIRIWEEFMKDRSQISESAQTSKDCDIPASTSANNFEYTSYSETESEILEQSTCMSVSDNRNYSEKYIEYDIPQTSAKGIELFSNVYDEENKKQKNNVDLIEFDKPAAISIEEHENRLALALFSNGFQTTISSTWENFNSPRQQPDHKAPWEIALESSTASSSANSNSMAGGFDPLLLDSLYNQTKTHQMHSRNNALNGSASSVALQQPNSSFLALPAPQSTSTAPSEDPFKASAIIAPPSYVQMEDTKRKYWHLLQEQQLWQQYEKNGMRGYCGYLHLSSNPFSVPETSPFDQNYMLSGMRGRTLQSNYNMNGVGVAFAHNAY